MLMLPPPRNRLCDHCYSLRKTDFELITILYWLGVVVVVDLEQRDVGRSRALWLWRGCRGAAALLLMMYIPLLEETAQAIDYSLFLMKNVPL